MEDFQSSVTLRESLSISASMKFRNPVRTFNFARYLTFVSLLCLLAALDAPLAIGQENASSAPTESESNVPPFSLNNQSELGIISIAGNVQNETYNAKHSTIYKFYNNALELNGNYFYLLVNDAERAKNWDAGFRYDHSLAQKWWIFAAERVESNKFAGYDLRYNTDLGLRHLVVHDSDWSWASEFGYRLFEEYQVLGLHRTTNNTRIASDLQYRISERANARWTLEYVVSTQSLEDYRIQSEISLANKINAVLALKVSYKVRYNNQPPPYVLMRQDRFITTSLVAEY